MLSFGYSIKLNLFEEFKCSEILLGIVLTGILVID